jgi:hypothetical protein
MSAAGFLNRVCEPEMAAEGHRGISSETLEGGHAFFNDARLPACGMGGMPSELDERGRCVECVRVVEAMGWKLAQAGE